LFFERPEAGRQALLLQARFRHMDFDDTPHECVELARSAEIDVVGVITATRNMPHPRWFVGEGKLVEIKRELAAAQADLLVVNGELSAGQQRNLERELDCRVLTRTELILHIFADRARTHEGQLQVELAQLTHAQTRLVRGWTHLDRQKGGIGLRGAGETQIELDQRMLGELHPDRFGFPAERPDQGRHHVEDQAQLLLDQGPADRLAGRQTLTQPIAPPRDHGLTLGREGPAGSNQGGMRSTHRDSGRTKRGER